MSDKIIENNQVTVIGSVASEFTYSHEVFGEGFYMVDILVKRLSNSSDRIPVMVSERLIDVTQDYKGRSIMVCQDSSGHITVMKNRKTDLFFQCLHGKWNLSKKNPTVQRQIIFYWKDICARHRYIEKPL